MAAGSEPGEPSAPPKPRFVIANINRGSLSAHTVVGIIQTLHAGIGAASFVMAESGPYLDAGRNKAVANALTIPDWDWLVFIDSDIEFTPAHLTQLLAPTLHPSFQPTSYPVIGGLYMNPFPDMVPGEEPAPNGLDGQIGPVAYEWVERDDLLGELQGIPTYTFRRLSRANLATLPPVDEEWNPEGAPSPVTEVGCVGTGFMAIHRHLFEVMSGEYGEPLPWFNEPVREGVHYGEDMGFCLRVRDLGYPVLVHRAVTVLHHKTIKLL